MGERAGTGASLDDLRAGFDVKIGGDEGDVGEVEDLGAVREGEGPEFGGGFEEVDEASVVGRSELVAPGLVDKVVVAEAAVL